MMSLFKGFSVVGLALERFFLENTKLCSGPAAWAVCTDRLGSDLDAGTGMGLGLTAARAVCLCARESRSVSCARWGDDLNDLGMLRIFLFVVVAFL